MQLGRRGRGLPARAIPVECFHTASIGIDLMLGALAWGASQVCVLTTERTADTYAAALAKQMGFAQAIVRGMRERMGGGETYIPAPDRSARRAAIRSEFNGTNLEEVCRKYGVSARTVYRAAGQRNPTGA